MADDQLSSPDAQLTPTMPPSPPFNTPAGDASGSEASESSACANGGPVASSCEEQAILAEKLSGLAINGDQSADGGAMADNGDKERDDVDVDIEVDEDEDDEDEDEEENGDDDDDEDEVNLPPEVMKRLYELKALQSEKDLIYNQYKLERAILEIKFAEEYEAVYTRRAQIVAGPARIIEADAAEGEGASEAGVPHFWMQCMLHHEALHEVVCEPDLEALYYLSDVRCIDKKDLLGFTLEFHFDENPYLSNAVLSKRYDTANIMDQGEPLLEGVEGTPIEWKTGQNLCEKTIERKIKRGGSRSGESRTVTKIQKTDSFFKFFQNPIMYDVDDEEELDENEEYNFSFDMDYEIARMFRNHLIPNAVLWFTGEAVSEDDDDDEDEDEELEDTDGLSEDERAMQHEHEHEHEVGGSEESDEEECEGGGTTSKRLLFQAPAGFGSAPGTTEQQPQQAEDCKQS